MSRKRATSTVTKSQDWVKIGVCVPSINQRLQKIRRALILTRAATAAITAGAAEDGSLLTIDELEADELGKAIADLVDSATDELYWITLLPAVVLDAPAPDDDEEKDHGEREELALAFLRDKISALASGAK